MLQNAVQKKSLLIISIIFFLSGFPALIYQIVWQRSLFSIFGINIESVTVVVTAFMLGLGFGSLLGGYISKINKIPLLILFGLIELGIGFYGLVSLKIFSIAGTVTLGTSTFQTGILSLGLVVLPTLLMGATLPILVNYFVSFEENVGKAVGILYFFNTLGSAVACFAVALILMNLLGMKGTLMVAAIVNLVAASIAFIFFFFQKRQPRLERSAVDETVTLSSSKLIPAILLAGIAGFISLSYEIIWFRIFSYMSSGLAPVFALLLGAFLTGIAIGSFFAGKLCKSKEGGGLKILSRLMLAASLVAFLVVPIITEVSARLGNESIQIKALAGMGMLGLVALAAAFLGATFPVLCHYAIPPNSKAGQGTSFLYLANIIGSAMGSLTTGYILLEYLNTMTVLLCLGLLGLLVTMILMWTTRKQGSIHWDLTATTLTAVILLASFSVSKDHLWSKLQKHYEPFAKIIENRHGVITVTNDGTLYGGGIYDGKFSTDLIDDENWIIRPYSVPAFHESPRKVLMIGLASGSWAKVLVNNPKVEELTVIEINPGYLDLIKENPVTASLLENPKLKVVIDDGRRWLKLHQNRRFDLIVMNTTFNWRAHTSNLLSAEFLSSVSQHLGEGGLLLFNTTGSNRSQHTACEVFPYVVRIYNNLYAGNSPIIPDQERWAKALDSYTIDDQPIFDLNNTAHMKRRHEVLSLIDTLSLAAPLEEGLEGREKIMRRTGGLKIISDDNMGHEWMPPPWIEFYNSIGIEL